MDQTPAADCSSHTEETSHNTQNGPAKYNGVVFEILRKYHGNFYSRIQHIFVHCVQKFVEI